MSTTVRPVTTAGIGLAVCVAAGTVSSLGSSIQIFALGWRASGYGAHAAGLVATFGTLPQVLLMLIGGAAADRYGIRRVMISCDAFLAATLAVALVILRIQPAGLIVIIALSVIGSAVSAFYLPAAGGFVRLFVTPDRLPRVLARVGSLQQLARLLGPSLGAVLVITVGLPGVIALDLISFLVVLAAFLIIRPPFSLQSPDARPEKMITGVLTALRAALRTPGMPASLAAVSLVAGSVLPILYLIVPLDVRARQWGAAAAGWLESAWVVGTLGVTVIVAVLGVHRRTGLMIT
ncbi:MAG: MFS transporter, partial [Microlunatus sp.]|nr:MFS transporter [Microlunatus sp.]